MVRPILFLVLSMVLVGVIFFRYDQSFGNDGIPSLGKRPTYAPYYPAWILPLFVVILPVILTPFYGFAKAVTVTVSTCAVLFLHISFYYLLLLALRPLLRGRISARTCAMLWVIPNLLYLTIQEVYQPTHPRWVLYLPGPWPEHLFLVWLVGCVGVLGWYILQHLRFRRRVLAPATPVTDPTTIHLWQEALHEVSFRNPKYQLVVSPAVTTPLSVGLFPRSTRVVLPPHPNTPEQLHWVLRHEVIHLARQDSATKFFLLFCTAICWFNPLMWVAMKGCAQDLELSCDETVLLFAKPEQRKEYAALLLGTAGNAQGFTTCLSASASTLRSRLKLALSPAARFSGALVAGLLFFLVTMTAGWVGLAWGTTSGAQALDPTWDPATVSAYGAHLYAPHAQPGDNIYAVTDSQALYQYLSDLTLAPLAGTYSFPTYLREFECFLSHNSDELFVAIHHQVLEVVVTGDGKVHSDYYYIPQGFDWDYLISLLREKTST